MALHSQWILQFMVGSLVKSPGTECSAFKVNLILWTARKWVNHKTPPRILTIQFENGSVNSISVRALKSASKVTWGTIVFKVRINSGLPKLGISRIWTAAYCPYIHKLMEREHVQRYALTGLHVWKSNIWRCWPRNQGWSSKRSAKTLSKLGCQD